MLGKALAALAVVGVGACAPPAVTGSQSPLAVTTTPTAVPMVVDGPSFSRSNGVETFSVFCIPADTVPLQLSSAAHWREVQVSEAGPDGPHGYWKQGRPCPDGPILHSG